MISRQKNFPMRTLFLVLGLLAIIALAGCAGSPTWFEPASSNAALITQPGVAEG